MSEERNLEKHLSEYCQKNRILFLKIRPETGRGFPDRLVITPSRIVMFLELKSKKRGVVSPHQDMWIRTLRRYNQFACVVDDLQDAKQYIEDIL